MEELFDALLFGDDLSPEERSSIQDQFDENPDLADAWAHWRAARRRMHERLEGHLSDRRLLVLYVLEQEGDDEVLTASEQAALDASRDDIARAIDAIPALEQVVERIRDERADFEEVWATHIGEDSLLTDEPAEASERTQRDPAERPDRTARAPRSRAETPARRWTRRLAVAAIVVGLAVAAVWFWPQGPDTTTVTVADETVQVKTLGNATVRLVGPATLSYPTGDARATPRRVTLERGRAFFDVQPLKEASFVVETPTATATVLGTQFGVTTGGDTTEVVLASGSVRVDDVDDTSGEGVVLEPGQHSRVAKGKDPTAPTPVDLTGALDWTGLFVFRSASLSTIVDRLNRHYEAQIAVAEPLADEAVTGTFKREQPVREVLGALAATLDATVQSEGDNQYRLVPAP